MIAGYHFDVQFGPNLPAVLPLLRERARAVGISVADDYDLRSRAMMLRVAGTHWADLTSGEVQFHVYEFRGDLDAFVVRDLCLTSKKLLASFGVAKEPKGWIATRLNKAVGLWIRDGSLLLHTWQDANEQMIVAFDMWSVLDDMARLAAGAATPLSVPDFETRTTPEPAKVSASFVNKAFSVAAAVTLMQRAGSSA